MSPNPILLMTRPQVASERFLAELRAAGAPEFTPVLSPLIDVIVTGALPDVGAADNLIFTSAQGVSSYQALGGPRGLTAYCVGSATAAAAEAAGLCTIDASGDAEALLSLLVQQRPDGPLWHLRGVHSRGDVAARLTQAGLPTQEAVLYDQRLLPLSATAKNALGGRIPVVVPLFSPRTATQFNAQKTGSAPLLIAAISPAVAEAVDAPYVVDMKVAQRPDAVAMIDVVTKLLKAAATLEAGGDAQ